MADTIAGFSSVVAKLRLMAAKARKDAAQSVLVGYEAPYAVFVHEDLEAHHETGQAKYLEEPLRTHCRDMQELVRRLVKDGRTVVEASLMAAELLLSVSKKLVPVRTGALRDSGFVRLE